MRRLVYYAALACLAALVHAQTTPAPKPPPELKQLDYFAGKLSCEGVTRPDNAKTLSTSECVWFKGGLVLECRTHDIAPQESTGVLILGYSTPEKAYTAYSYGSMGSGRDVSKGQRQGTTWTWTWDGEETSGKKPARFQMTITEDSSVKYHVQARRSVASGPWTVISEGTCTKAK